MKQLALGYAGTGGLAAVVDIGGFHVLARWLPDVVLTAALSFGAAAVVNYLLSSRWVWRQDWRHLGRALRFAGTACVGLSINAGMTLLMAQALHPTLAKAGGVALAFGANFLMNAWWVFGAGGLRSPSAGACGPAPGAPGRARHPAATAGPWPPGPSARE